MRECGPLLFLHCLTILQRRVLEAGGGRVETHNIEPVLKRRMTMADMPVTPTNTEPMRVLFPTRARPPVLKKSAWLSSGGCAMPLPHASRCSCNRIKNGQRYEHEGSSPLPS